MKYFITAFIALVLGLGAGTILWLLYGSIKWVFKKRESKILERKTLNELDSTEIRKELERRMKIK